MRKSRSDVESGSPTRATGGRARADSFKIRSHIALPKPHVTSGGQRAKMACYFLR